MQTQTANEILNDVAAEIGHDVVQDAYQSPDQEFVQLRRLLNVAGRMLHNEWNWEHLIGEHRITTAEGDTGDYPLPDDFSRMIPQTAWDHVNDRPVYGPLSPQDWTYLEGRGLHSEQIYAKFRQRQGLFSIYPQPPGIGYDLRFEYVRTGWALSSEDQQPIDKVLRAADIINFDHFLFSRLLKLKYLEAKGFDTTKAQDDYNRAFDLAIARDNTGPRLHLARGHRNRFFIDARSVPDTGYGTS